MELAWFSCGEDEWHQRLETDEECVRTYEIVRLYNELCVLVTGENTASSTITLWPSIAVAYFALIIGFRSI